MILKKIFLYSLVFILSGCQKVYYLNSPRGSFVESISEPFVNELIGDTTCNESWYYAKDSILVKNADISMVCKTDISRRVFSSKDICAVRNILNNEVVYFEIEKANAVNLGEDGMVPEVNMCFKINQRDYLHFFYIQVPYKKRKWFHFVHYSDEYPVTYLNNHHIVVHNTDDFSEATYDTIRQILLHDIDSVDVENWIRRCKQGRKRSPYYINKGRPILF